MNKSNKANKHINNYAYKMRFKMWCFRKKLEKFSHFYDVILTSLLSFEDYFNTTKSQIKQLSKRPWVGKGCI